MNKLLVSLLIATTCTFGCGQRWQMLGRLAEVADDLERGYTLSSEEKARNMRETRNALDRVKKIVRENEADNFRYKQVQSPSVYRR